MRPAQICGLFLLGTFSLSAQTLSPREIFYGEGKPAAAAKPPVRRVSTPKAKPATPAKPNQPVEEAKAAQAPSTPSAPANASLAAAGAGDPVYQTVSYSPLGLKYSLVKLDAGGQYDEVDPDVPFLAGDRIRVKVESNDTGYLYVVISQSSNGAWQMLYPSEDTGGMRGSNKVEKGHSYQIPSKGSFKFDENTGTEKLFVILSRQPEEDLEKMIYSLQESKHKTGQVSKAVMASNLQVEDELVKKMRQSYSRDLLIEKVDDSKPAEAGNRAEAAPKKVVAGAPKSEKAYYVVNPANTPDARVVADIPLRHQ